MFQRATDLVLATGKRQDALVYIDDITLFFNRTGKQTQYTVEVLKLLNNAGIMTESSKCSYFKESIDYSVYIIAPCSEQNAAKTTTAIKAVLSPAKILYICLFLGLCNVYRCFDLGFVKSVLLQVKTLKQRVPWQFIFDEDETKAVDGCDEKLVTPPAMARPQEIKKKPSVLKLWHPNEIFPTTITIKPSFEACSH